MKIFKTYFLLVISLFIFVALQGCATTINCQFESNPPGAKIYGGSTPARMEYIGVTPFTQTYTGTNPYWLQWYYQFKKEGYLDSKIIVAEQLPINTNRKVWAILEKQSPTKAPSPPNNVSIFSGTGWITTNGYIVTNFHVIDGQVETKVKFNSVGQDSYEANIILSDRQNDLAILELEDMAEINNVRGIPISTKLPKVGEEVFTIGYPKTSIMGKNPKVTNGIVSSLSGLRDDPRIIQTTVAIQSGNSGGPLLNMHGEAVGVTTSTLRTLVTESGIDVPQSVNYAVKSAYVLALLSSLPEKNHYPAVTLTSSKLEDMVPKIQDSIVQVIVKSN